MPLVTIPKPDRPIPAAVVATLATAATMLLLDLAWLGVVARGLYTAALGPLMRPEAYWPAAALFYAFYVAVIVAWAVFGADGLAGAARRGAGLGFVAYTTYELTNWAVLRDWPAWIVPVDIAWGIALTAVAALAGKFGERSLLSGRGIRDTAR
ncbi:MAG: DUF2177 family protein [Acidobacteria bacterium]|nr:DUF2177 family protein [Acidobacteriota bacterium]MCG3192448.1 hypothetical protein [Thermoanaerobaculia bacterium]